MAPTGVYNIKSHEQAKSHGWPFTRPNRPAHNPTARWCAVGFCAGRLGCVEDLRPYGCRAQPYSTPPSHRAVRSSVTCCRVVSRSVRLCRGSHLKVTKIQHAYMYPTWCIKSTCICLIEALFTINLVNHSFNPEWADAVSMISTNLRIEGGMIRVAAWQSGSLIAIFASQQQRHSWIVGLSKGSREPA